MSPSLLSHGACTENARCQAIRAHRTALTPGKAENPRFWRLETPRLGSAAGSTIAKPAAPPVNGGGTGRGERGVCSPAPVNSSNLNQLQIFKMIIVFYSSIYRFF